MATLLKSSEILKYAFNSGPLGVMESSWMVSKSISVILSHLFRCHSQMKDNLRSTELGDGSYRVACLVDLEERLPQQGVSSAVSTSEDLCGDRAGYWESEGMKSL
ncbi:hypothetical protein CapIbe_003777 [Capra ibex]